MKEGILNKKPVLAAGAAAVIIIIIILLFSRNGSGDYSGYYVKTDGNKCYVISIRNNEFTCYTNTSSQGYFHTGHVESGEACGYVYLDDDSRWRKHSPLILTKSDDGKRLYVDSNNDNWSMDIYESVSKADIEQALDAIAADKGMDSWEDWLGSLMQ